MNAQLSVIAGALSTVIFVISTFPMLLKALRTKNLKSYSLSTMLLANTGNAIHSVYVFSLSPGPIWVLHLFHLTSTALMLVWYLRYEWLPKRVSTPVGSTVRELVGARLVRFGTWLEQASSELATDRPIRLG